MNKIQIEHNPAPAKLEVMGVYDWPIWQKEASTFPWTYDSKETCYILEGSVTVTPENGEPVTMGEYDLFSFPEGMKCTWEIHAVIQKHYDFA
mgnify:FL=1